MVLAAGFQANLRWKYHQIKTTEDRAKYCLKNECNLVEVDWQKNSAHIVLSQIFESIFSIRILEEFLNMTMQYTTLG